MTRGGTVHPAPIMDPKKDAAAMETAMKGMGCNKQAIIDILANRSVFQRQLIAEAYKSGYGEVLKKRLISELSGDFQDAILASFYDQAHVDARAMFKAMMADITDKQILIDVMCTSTNEEIAALRDAYNDILLEAAHDLEGRSLEVDLKKNTSGDFQRLMVALCQGMRGVAYEDDLVATETEAVYEAGEGKMGTDDSLFIRILATRSWLCIKKINAKYLADYGHDLLTAIDKEFSGNMMDALLTVVQTAIDRNTCQADILYGTMKGAGTRDQNLIRIIIGHSETDLAVIRYYFDGRQKEKLSDMIKADTSGDYQKYLLAILGEAGRK